MKKINLVVAWLGIVATNANAVMLKNNCGADVDVAVGRLTDGVNDLSGTDVSGTPSFAASEGWRFLRAHSGPEVVEGTHFFFRYHARGGAKVPFTPRAQERQFPTVGFVIEKGDFSAEQQQVPGDPRAVENALRQKGFQTAQYHDGRTLELGQNEQKIRLIDCGQLQNGVTRKKVLGLMNKAGFNINYEIQIDNQKWVSHQVEAGRHAVHWFWGPVRNIRIRYDEAAADNAFSQKVHGLDTFELEFDSNDKEGFFPPKFEQARQYHFGLAQGGALIGLFPGSGN